MDSTRVLELTNAANLARPRTRAAVEFEMSSRASSISGIRSRARAFARSMGFAPDDLDDICIAVGEASTNAVKHGRSPAYPRIGVRMENHPDALRVFITDAGPGFDPCALCPPGEGDLSECGRGIMCMRALMDEVIFHSMRPGTRVEMAKYVGGAFSSPLPALRKSLSRTGA